jgi:hypothetical protein
MSHIPIGLHDLLQGQFTLLVLSCLFDDTDSIKNA